MVKHQSKTHLRVHTKALLAFILALSLTVAMMSIPLWSSL